MDANVAALRGKRTWAPEADQPLNCASLGEAWPAGPTIGHSAQTRDCRCGSAMRYAARTPAHGMLACLLLTTASLCGFALALPLRIPLGPGARLALGIALGQLIVLWVPFGIAACFDLSVYSAGICTTALLVLSLTAKNVCDARPSAFFTTWRLGGLVVEQLRAAIRAATLPNRRALSLVSLALFALLVWLHATHYLMPRERGLHSAGVTWGDLPLHLALATRALYAPGLFAIEHPLYLHGPLVYPFLPDYSVAVLCALGLPLRAAFCVGGLVPLATMFPLLSSLTTLWFLDRGSASAADGRAATQITHASSALPAALSCALFFLAGGLGCAIVLRSMVQGAAPLATLASTNATYIDPWVLKANVIGNLFIAARSAAYGMPLGAAALLLLGHAAEDGRGARAPWLLGSGIVALLPLIHGHSFVALCVVVLVYGAWLLRRGQLHALTGFALIALIALPQLLWLAAQGAPSALRVELGFLRPAPDLLGALRDIALDLGVWLLLVPLGLVLAPARARRLTWPLLLLLPLSACVCFTPAQYDNVKLLAWFDLAAAPLTAAALVRIGRSALGRACAWLLGLGCTLSGLFAVAFELTNDALVISYPDLQLAAFVRERTPPNAVIATAASYHDPVAMLSGRRVPLAAPAMLGTHGIFPGERARDVILFYRGGADALAVQKRLGIDAALVSERERRELPWLNEDFLRARATRVHEHRAGRLYLLSPAP